MIMLIMNNCQKEMIGYLLEDNFYKNNLKNNI